MAGNSGSFRVRFHPSYATSGSGYYLTINWSQSDPFSEQAIRTNTTTLTATMYVGGKGSGYHINASAKNNHKIIVNSVSKTGTSAVGFSSENNYTARTLMSASFPITHNTNGTATAVIRGQANINISTSSGKIGTAYIPGSGSGNTQSLTLATIPRPSTTSISQSSMVEIGNTIIFNINKNLDELTHTLLYSFDKTTWKTIASNITDTTLSWDLSESLAENFPNTTSTLIHFRTDTYLNNNNSLQKIGSEQFSTTLSLKREVGKPILSELIVKHTNPKIDQTNNLLENYLILNKSQISASTNANPFGGAEIKYFVYNINGISYNISPSGENLTNGIYSFLLKDNIGSIAKDLKLNISVYAIDSRGFQSDPVTATKESVLAYRSPTISNIKMIRGRWVTEQIDGESKTVFEEYAAGKILKLNFMYNIDPLSTENGTNLNSKNLSFKYSVNGSSLSSPEIKPLENFESDINLGYSFIPDTFPEIDLNAQYRIYLAVQDALSSITEILNIRSKGTLLNFGASGYSAAIGGKAIDDKFTIFYPTLFHEGIEYKELVTDGSEASVNLNDLTSGWYSFRGTPSDEKYNFPLTPTEIYNLNLIDKGTIQVSGLSSSSIEWQIQKISYLSEEGKIFSFSRSYSGTWSNWEKDGGMDEDSKIDYSRITAIESSAGEVMLSNNQGSFDLVGLDNSFKNYLDNYFKTYALDIIYPIGSIYIGTDKNKSPSVLFGGTWELIQGKFLYAAEDGQSSGVSGGAKTDSVTLSVDNHRHLTGAGINGNNIVVQNINEFIKNTVSEGYARTVTGTTGGTTAYITYTSYNGGFDKTFTVDTMPPYLTVYVWKRTK